VGGLEHCYELLGSAAGHDQNYSTHSTEDRKAKEEEQEEELDKGRGFVMLTASMVVV
jgi:hypothetical protein